MQDDGSGRQQWVFTRTANNTGYYIEILTGRAGCSDYLATVACGSAEGGLVTFAPGDDGTGLQIWNVIAPAPPAPPTQVLANGNYYVAKCASCPEYSLAPETGQSARKAASGHLLSRSRVAGNCHHSHRAVHLTSTIHQQSWGSRSPCLQHGRWDRLWLLPQRCNLRQRQCTDTGHSSRHGRPGGLDLHLPPQRSTSEHARAAIVFASIVLILSQICYSKLQQRCKPL